MNRRDFIRSGTIGLAGFTILNSCKSHGSIKSGDSVTIDQIKLGKSGLTVARVAMGTGTHGGNKASDMTRLGMEGFVKLANHAFERGITFYDTADSYGSIPYVGEAIKSLPRKKLTLLTKMWTQDDNAEKKDSVEGNIDRYLKEFGTDYIDIVLMHCLMRGDWGKNRTYCMDGLSKAKKAGKIRAIGVSCHNIDALREAAVNPWVEVIMARINPFGTLMDGSPDEIKAILATATANGKGVIAMKIFGEGKNVSDDERERSIRYAIHEANSHCMTLGMTSTAQIDDAVERVMRNRG
ncbi:MAG: aldo/keto reductase [Tannerella sp.]|jgi:aryl-alcohol dehydrogenase-like predicted oxidoreductase|nr:aldo/keto reductase [Tannerella sp.]